MPKTIIEVKKPFITGAAPIGLVITAGRVRACTWSPDTDLTAEKVRAAWRENPRDFRPYDETRGVYLS